MPEVLPYSADRPASRPTFSIPSIVAAVAVLISLFTEYFDVLLAVVAIVSGVIGAIMALSPRVRGGILSIVSLVIAVGSIIVSIFQVIF